MCVCGLTYCQLIGNRLFASSVGVREAIETLVVMVVDYWWWRWSEKGSPDVMATTWRSDVMTREEKSFLLEKLVQRREGEKECEMKVMIVICWCIFLLVSSFTKVDHHHKCSGFIFFFCEKSESEEWEIVCVCVFWWGKEKCLLPLLCFFLLPVDSLTTNLKEPTQFCVFLLHYFFFVVTFVVCVVMMLG